MFLSRPLRKKQPPARRRKRYRRSIWLGYYYLLMGFNSVILSCCKYGSWRGRVLSVFRGAALNPTVSVFWRPFAAADLSHGFRMERATVDFTAAKPLFPARQLFRERVNGNVRQWEWEWRRRLDTPPSGHLRGCVNVVNTNPKHTTETQIHCSFTTIYIVELRDFVFFISCCCLCLRYHI